VNQFQFPLHRDPRCNQGVLDLVVEDDTFQFPLHRDPRCNRFRPCICASNSTFQFPLHRDPRCNGPRQRRRNRPNRVSVPFTSGSSLQRQAMPVFSDSASKFQFPLHRDPRCNLSTPCMLLLALCFSSLYIGILAATLIAWFIWERPLRFSSLYIGILAATKMVRTVQPVKSVSVPFTSGSSLQRLHSSEILRRVVVSVPFTSGSSLQLDNSINMLTKEELFQFPLHRDPRCNLLLAITLSKYVKFQFPLHRDPRCNVTAKNIGVAEKHVSVPFTSGSSLQRGIRSGSWWQVRVSVPFTSGSSLQLFSLSRHILHKLSFSSLYIGILAATI